MRDNGKDLSALIREVMDEMRKRKYGKRISTRYKSSFHLLISISHDIREDKLSERLIEAFLGSPVDCSEKWAGKPAALYTTAFITCTDRSG